MAVVTVPVTLNLSEGPIATTMSFDSALLELPGVAGPEGPIGMTGPQGPAGPMGLPGPQGLPGIEVVAGGDLTVHNLAVTGWITMQFTGSAAGKHHYAPIRWQDMDDIDSVTGIGRIVAQEVAHVYGDDGVNHSHICWYTREDAEPNERKHHVSIEWPKTGKGRTRLVLDSLDIVEVQYNAPTNHYVLDAVTAQSKLVSVRNGLWTVQSGSPVAS